MSEHETFIMQVGSYSSSSTSKQPDITKSKEALAIAASAATAKAAASVTSSTTLYDLCDSSYNLKYCKRERKKKESITAEEKAIAEVRNKNAILENARSNSSSSSKNQRMKEQCGMGPRVEIVNGKIIVRESSLVSIDAECRNDVLPSPFLVSFLQFLPCFS
jgi:hypothetical protein